MYVREKSIKGCVVSDSPVLKGLKEREKERAQSTVLFSFGGSGVEGKWSFTK